MGDQVRLTAKKTLTKRNNSAPRTQSAALRHSLNSPADQILNLQRTIGNQAVQRILNSGIIQAKLKIGEPNDIYEQNADRVAEQVMSMPDPQLQRQGIEEEEGEEAVRAKQLYSPISPQAIDAMHNPANSPGLRIQKVCTECEEEMQRQPEEEDELAQTKSLLRSGQREAISRRPDTRGNRGIVRLNFLSTTGLSRTIQRWRMGRGASPPGEPNFRPVTRNHQARVFAALRLLSRIVRRRRCRNYFRDNCPGGTSRTVGNLFFNRMVVWALHERGSLGGNTGDHVAYEDPYLWRIGHWAIAGSLLHEMMHACGIGTSAAEEVTCETAIERCHNYTPFIESVSPLSGRVGTTITITGFGFGMSQGRFDRVLFNGVNAGAATVWRYGHGVGSEIQVRVPRGATTGSLVVINNRVRSNTRQFTVTP